LVSSTVSAMVWIGLQLCKSLFCGRENAVR
jgi:hypothetical protein